jgi:hypothetical protein
LNRKVAVLVLSIRRPAKGRLECEAVYQVEFSPHNHSGCRLSRFLDGKVAIGEREVFGVFAKQQRKNAFLQAVSLLISAPIHEQVLGTRMTVVVAVKQDVAAVLRFSHHDLRGVILWTQLGARGDPLAV